MKKRKIVRGFASALCALLLSLSIMSTYQIPVNAAGTVTHASMYKIVDMALAKTGIVANNDIINSITEDFINDCITVVNEYVAYLETTYGETYEDLADIANADTFDEFVAQASEAVATIVSSLPDVIINTLVVCVDVSKLTAEYLADCLLGVEETGIVTGVGYKIGDDAVEYIRDTFDDYAESEADYYYIDTVGPDDLHPGWFPNKTTYDNFVTYLSESPYVVFLEFMKGTNGSYFSITSENNASFTSAKFHICFDGVHLIHNSGNGTFASEFYRVNAVNDEWNNLTTKYRNSYISEYTFESFEELSASSTSAQCDWTWVSNLEREMTGTDASVGFCTNDGRKMKVFKDLSTMKLYDVGQQPYYLVQENDYSTTNDNSVTFSGDYYQNNSDSYSYDIIQNEIDNSTEINEETVNNIVNTSTTTIINNYYASSGGGSGSDDGTIVNPDGVIDDITDIVDVVGDIWDGALGAVGGLLSGLVDGLEIVLDPLEKATDLITNILNGVRYMTEDLDTTFKDFTLLMGDMFSFIPEEIINLIKASLGVTVSICLFKWLFK